MLLTMELVPARWFICLYATILQLIWRLILNLMHAGRCFCVGEGDTRTHSWRILLWLPRLADSWWLIGGALRCQVGVNRVLRSVHRRNSPDTCCSTNEFGFTNLSKSSVWNRFGTRIISIFTHNNRDSTLITIVSISRFKMIDWIKLCRPLESTWCSF